MDFLKAEIERKKRKLESSNVLAPDKRYYKRGDLAAKETEEYWRKHGRLRELTEHSDSDSQDSPSHSQAVEESKSQDEKIPQLSRKEVIRRLRERGEPIILFGESEFEAFLRLKKLEALEPDIKKGEGANDFKTAMDQVDQDYLNEIIKSGSSNTSNRVSIKDEGTTLDDVEIMKNEIGKGDSEKDQECILTFLKFVLTEWGNSLNIIPEAERQTTKNRIAFATHTQTVSYMKPLFRKLKHKKVQEDILQCLTDIVKHLMDRHYIMANHHYMEMSIGNAPWPIGVTMVGIHARTGREKISSRYVAHVLNDETQRKYIQGLKRLMTQSQRIFPTEPSRSVDYEKT